MFFFNRLLSQLCCSFLVLVVFALCLVYPMLSVSSDCPFLIAPPVFSDVYKYKIQDTRNMSFNIAMQTHKHIQIGVN